MDNINQQIKAELELHTLQAQSLCRGRKKIKSEQSTKYSTIGLIEFGFMMLQIWQQIKKDDPYAESVLIETERCINNAFAFIKRKHNLIDTELNNEFPGIHFEIFSSPNPKIIKLNSIIYSTTHTNLAARLIGLYDQLVRKLVTCKKYALIKRDDFDSHIQNSKKIISGALSAPASYKTMNIIRQDIVQKSPKGLMAIEKLGILPMEIINKQIHTEFGPKPPSYS